MEPTSASKTGRTSSPAVSFMLAGAPSPSPLGSLISRIKSPHASGGSNRSSRGQSAFTPVVQQPGPVLTPSGRNSSMVLLSPSRTISESLTALASSTAHQLEEVWDEVGYNPEERASQLSDLLVQFRDLCDAKIAEERGVAETFRQTIVDAKEEMRTTSKALKTHVDPQLLKDNQGQSLTDELASLEAALEGLRSVASTSKKDLKECHEQLKESHDALGIELDAKWNDVESDLTASRREEFHRKVSEMKEALSTRTTAVIQLLRDCQHLMKDLRIDAEENGTDLDRQIAGSLVRSKDGSFIMASKFKSDTCTGLSSTAMEELTNRVAELSGEKRRRKAKLTEMGAKIATLWEKLRVPEDEQRAFTESVQGLGMDTIEKGELELKRLREMKAQMLGKLVTEAREKISVLWDQTNATPEQRQSFEPAKIEDETLFNDELLEQHDEYVRVLEARLDQMKPILRLIERREDILRERMEYEELQKHSDRLQQRGAELTKQLMMEEKMARRIKKDLPKLTSLLDEKLREWQKAHDEHFQYRGEVYLQVMKRQEEEWRQYKENEKRLNLMKNQQEKTSVENRSGVGKNFRSLPGKKKAHKTRPGIVSQPLADARGKANARTTARERMHA